MVACLHYDAQALGVRNGRQLGRAALGRYGAGSWHRSRPKSGSSGLAWYCEAPPYCETLALQQQRSTLHGIRSKTTRGCHANFGTIAQHGSLPRAIAGELELHPRRLDRGHRTSIGGEEPLARSPIISLCGNVIKIKLLGTVHCRFREKGYNGIFKLFNHVPGLLELKPLIGNEKTNFLLGGLALGNGFFLVKDLRHNFLKIRVQIVLL